MDWLYYSILIVVQIIGLALALFQMPGLWLMLAATGVYAWVTMSRGYVGWSLVVLLILALLAEAVEFVAGGAGAKKAGASKMGMFAAMLGGIVGAILGTFVVPIPIVGTIIGACIGSFVGAMGVEYYKRQDLDHSLRVGYGAAQGRLMGILGKLAIGCVMLLVTIVVALPIGGRPATGTVPTVLILPATTQAATQTTTLPVER